MFALLQPHKIRFETGGFADLGKEAAALGSRALVVCGRHATKAGGALPRGVHALAAAGVDAVVFAGIAGEPTCAMVDAAANRGRERRCDVVIGLGGGSAMDAAKAAAMLVANPGTTEAYHDGERVFERPGVPLITVPTTAGSGAEVTRNAVLTQRSTGIKKSLRGPGMGAATALVDAELTLSLPPEATANGGMDALTQAMECYLSRAAQPVSDALSLRAIAEIYANLEGAYRDGGNLRHREPVMLGSLLAGIAFSNAALGAVHGLSHPLGSHLHLPHGFVCGVLLPHVLEVNCSHCRERFTDLARVMGVADGAAVIDVVRELKRRLGLPETLRAHGLNEDLFPRILAECRSGSMSNNPVEMSNDDVVALLRRLL